MHNDLYNYEKTISDEKKKDLGIVYTPPNIVDFINKEVLRKWKSNIPPKVIDFSCGTGVFLVDMCDKIATRFNLKKQFVYDNYIYANDIDKDATDIFKQYTKCPNITNLDGLDFDLSNYDIIIGNPPYVKIQNLSEDVRKKIRNFSWCEKGNSDIYIALSEKTIKSRKIFGFICPNSWIKSATGTKMVKDILQSKKMSNLIDFRTKKVFNNIGAYCCILIGDDTIKNNYKLSFDVTEKEEIINYSEISKDNFFLPNNERTFLLQNSTKDTKLLDICSFNVGLATLSDKLYFLKDCNIKNDYVITDDLKIELNITKKCYKAGKLTRYDLTRNDRIIYPYDEDGKPYTENQLEIKFPMAYEYLISVKPDLLLRDNGKFKKLVNQNKINWYEYGRKQGLGLQDDKILISPIIGSKHFLHITDGLFISGYCIIPKHNKDKAKIINVLKSSDFKEWIKIYGSPKSGGYYSISKKAIENFRF
jgi:adenine-specific DNA-methyltransferase